MLSSIRRFFYIIIAIVILYMIGIFFIYIFIDFIVFSPVKHSQNHKYSISQEFRELKLDHPNGQKLNLLVFESQIPVKAYLLYLHGTAKSADHWAEQIPFFTSLGFQVIMPDYRGYGKSQGSPTENGLYEDAQISYGWLKGKTTEDSIYIYGVDFSASVAAYLATISPCRHVILDNPIYSLRSWMRTKFPLLVLPYELKYDFNVYEFIPNVISPLSILYTTNHPFHKKAELKNILNLVRDPGSIIWMEKGGQTDPAYIQFFNQMISPL
ncbi:MAG: alpha/beta fold hydrolase [Saprospiraceae bacterium]|nr:alpha/beta fold hydrolase [Saprospiraceae bacterium]